MSYWTEQTNKALRDADLSRTNMTTVGDALGVRDRTLRRRLADEGVKFNSLVEAERKRRCHELLANNSHTGGKVLADACGYASLTSFYRAFAAWHNMKFIDARRNPEAIGAEQC